MKHIIQKDEHDCGIACICMILEHDFNINVNYHEVKSCIEISEKGIRLDRLIEYLNKYDHYKAYECEFNSLPNYPFITIINIKNKYQHYIVVWKRDNKFIYYSNPSEDKMKKIKLSRFKKLYQGIIVFFKEKEISNIEYKKKYKINNISKYLYPLIFLNILEILLFMFSIVYLFNKEFNIIKITVFFTILTLQIIIYLLKNYFMNLININMDKTLLNYSDDNSINQIKEKIKKGYYIKNKKSILYNKIIPQLIISFTSIIIFFYLHYLLALSMILLLLIYFFICFNYYKKRNKYNSKLILLENEFNKTDSSVKELINEMSNNMKKLSKANNAYTIISVFYRQCLLIFIMLFFALIKQSNYTFIGVYLCFYSFDFINAYADYKSDKKTYNYVLYSFDDDNE